MKISILGAGDITKIHRYSGISEKDTKKFTEYIYTKLPFITWAPIQFTSALTGSKVKKILDLDIEINEERHKKLTDSELNRFLNRVVKLHRPAKSRGTKHPRIYEIKQTYIDPPEFTLRIGVKDTLHFSYIRFIQNRLREKYGFVGTPVTIHVTKKRK